MTEEEWRNSQDPMRMLLWLGERLSERKYRLYLVACVRRIWHLVTDPRSRALVEVVEQFAEGRLTFAALRRPQLASAAVRRKPRERLRELQNARDGIDEAACA